MPRLLAVIAGRDRRRSSSLLALLLLIVPILSKELPLLREQLPLLVERINRSRLALAGADRHRRRRSTPPASRRFVAQVPRRQLGRVARRGADARRASAAASCSAIVGYVILVPVVLFYLLARLAAATSQRAASTWCRRGCAASVDGFTDECDAVLGQYLRGQLLVMLLLAAFYSVGLALFGFDLAVPVGVFTGLAIFIPYVGFGIGLVLALIAGVLQFAGWYGPIARRRRLRHRPDRRGPVPDAEDGGRAHRHEPADGDLRAVRLRPPVRLRRRADRAAGERADRGRRARGCARATSSSQLYRG